MSSVLGTYARKPIAFKEGKGSYLFTENGEKYRHHRHDNQQIYEHAPHGAWIHF